MKGHLCALKALTFYYFCPTLRKTKRLTQRKIIWTHYILKENHTESHTPAYTGKADTVSCICMIICTTVPKQCIKLVERVSLCRFHNLIICYIKMECFRNPVTMMERQRRARSLIPWLSHHSMYHSNWNVKSSICVKYWSVCELLVIISHFSSVTYHSTIKKDMQRVLGNHDANVGKRHIIKARAYPFDNFH